jgi:hypothetical protein
MTVTGKKGDEWINSADREQYIHDGVVWWERPFADRLAVAKSAAFTQSWSTNVNPWNYTIPETTLDFRKVRADTRIYVEGFITTYPSTGTIHGVTYSAWYGAYVHGHDVMQHGNPPGDSKDVQGYIWYNENRHISCQLAGFIRGTVSAGDHTIELQMGTKHGHVAGNSDDFWALRVWEVL